MNRTNFEHALCAVLIMAALWLAVFLLGVPSGQWVGAAAGIAFFAGREFTQAQRTIAKAGGVTLTDLPWHRALDLSRWSLDALLDLLFPVVSCLALAYLVPLLL
ncbi:hypothetical protein [Pseudomonas serbica]